MRTPTYLVRFGALLVVLAAGVLAFSASAYADRTLFSSTTPGPYSATVPLGVTSVTVTAVGGSGGAAVNNGIAGGKGGIITATATVAPGDSLSITVGANGVCGSGGNVPECFGTGGSGAGNGGSSPYGYGGGGGGGSAVSDGATTLVVAGGGGGSAQGPGGNADQNGSNLGGFAGTLSGPGAGACEFFGFCSSPGVGMNGGGGAQGDSAGGGGGYFGGGAALNGGAGGGASYPAPATQWDTTATPYVTITYTVPPARTELALEMSGEGKTGKGLTTMLEEGVTFNATLTGADSGTITFWFTGAENCNLGNGGRYQPVEVTATSSSTGAAAYGPEYFDVGTVYVFAEYGGDTTHQASRSECEILKVTPGPAHISTSLSGGGQNAKKITVPEGTAVVDQASIENLSLRMFPGTVEYKVYSDKLCTEEVADAGKVNVERTGYLDLETIIGPSTTETVAPGEYYWQASYSGNDSYLPSVSECGSEVETVAGPPTAKIISPEGGGVYSLNKLVDTEYECEENPFGPGLASCEEQKEHHHHHHDRPGEIQKGTLDTSTLGPHTYTATAESEDGQTGKASIKYTVAAPPTAKIESPEGGKTYAEGKEVNTKFSCTEGEFGPGLESCGGVAGAHGTGTLNTETPGEHEYTVTAKSKDGQEGTTSIKYTVISACTGIRGAGRAGPIGTESVQLADELSLHPGAKEQFGAGVWKSHTLTQIRLTALTGSSCRAIHEGREFAGEGPATVKNVAGYETKFSFAFVGSHITFSIELTKGGKPVYKYSAPLTGSTTERLY